MMETNKSNKEMESFRSNIQSSSILTDESVDDKNPKDLFYDGHDDIYTEVYA